MYGEATRLAQISDVKSNTAEKTVKSFYIAFVDGFGISGMKTPHLDTFVAYCMEFYGKKGLYYNPKITPESIKNAVCELALKGHNFGDGDSFDREKVRDEILGQRGRL